MSRRISILIVTHSPTLPTGMAETTRLIFGGLLDKYPDNYDLHQIGLFQCYSVTESKWPVYGTKHQRARDGSFRLAVDDINAEKTFPEIVRKIQPDVVFAFNNPQNVTHLCLPSNRRSHRLVLFLNIDGFPIRPGDGLILDEADVIVTMSDFGKCVAASCLPDVEAEKLRFIYSPADTDRFTPISTAEKATLRRDLFPAWMSATGFVLGWVGRNQWRKQVWIMYKLTHYLRTGMYRVCPDCERVSLLEWDPVKRCHRNSCERSLSDASVESAIAKNGLCGHCGCPNAQLANPLKDIFLWMHMPQDDPLTAWPVRQIENQFMIQRGRDLHYTEGCGLMKALAPSDMPVLYQLWDCLIYLSGGEGFGIPAWEAMCSALPVIFTNYSSHAEFLGKADAGLPVGGMLQPESKSCIWRMVADVSQAIEAVRKLYFDRELAWDLGKRGRAFTLEHTVAIQAEKWHRLFQAVARSPGMEVNVDLRAEMED